MFRQLSLTFWFASGQANLTYIDLKRNKWQSNFINKGCNLDIGWVYNRMSYFLTNLRYNYITKIVVYAAIVGLHNSSQFKNFNYYVLYLVKLAGILKKSVCKFKMFNCSIVPYLFIYASTVIMMYIKGSTWAFFKCGDVCSVYTY